MSKNFKLKIYNSCLFSKTINSSYVALFRRGDQQSIFMSQYHSNVLQEILNRVHSGQQLNRPTIRPMQSTQPPPKTINCEKQPGKFITLLIFC